VPPGTCRLKSRTTGRPGRSVFELDVLELDGFDDPRRGACVRLVRLVALHPEDFEHPLHGGERTLQLGEGVHDVPHRVQQQERVPLERHDVADRCAPGDVQEAAVPDDHHVDDADQQPPAHPQHELAPVREQVLAKDGVAPEHVLEQLARLAAEGAHNANAGKRLSDPAVDLLDVLAGHAVDRPHPPREDEAHHHRAGNDGHRHHREPPIQRQQDGQCDDQPDDRDRRRDDRHLHQPGSRVDIAGQPRQDPARLHVPQPRQRQVHQPFEYGAAQRQHHAHVQEPLPVVAERLQRVRQQDHDQERNTRRIQARQPQRGRQIAVQEHAIDDEPHEQRLDHLEPGDQQREQENRRHRQPVRRQPAQVLAQVFAPLVWDRRRRRLGTVGRCGRLVEAVVPVIVDELAVTPA
jgi:hypothetical protein